MLSIRAVNRLKDSRSGCESVEEAQTTNKSTFFCATEWLNPQEAFATSRRLINALACDIMLVPDFLANDEQDLRLNADATSAIL